MNVLKEISIGSDMINLNIVQQFIEEICDEYNINNNYFGNISVAVNEAVRNAIIHGNKLKHQKKVKISLIRKNYAFTFLIQDEGKGFDFDSIQDPTDINILNAGTGIFLIKNLADEVTYFNNGSIIEISFFIRSINQTLSNDRAFKLKEYQFQKINKEVKNIN